jgi:histidinol dehydrogenase
VIDLRAGDRLPPALPLAIDENVVATVREIIADVRDRGDAALVELTKRFDGVDLSTTGVAVPPDEFRAAQDSVPDDVRSAIDAMIERLRDLHARQLRGEWWEEREGLRFGEIVRPVRRAGCYVPGGRAAYPSTVAMTVVPASVAGVEEITVATPPRADGSVAPEVLYAAERAGADRVIKVGGAQAIAALAYGTDSIPAVDVIVGPGNVYVTAAKREVVGEVGIDGLAGPTELAIVADETADPVLIAADLVAQAEHDPLATGTVVTTEPDLLGRLPEDIQQARVLVVRDLDHAADVVNELAPEHLEVLVAEPRAFLPLVRNAGAVFLGPWSAVPFGDYGVGSNHVLPTMATARFASGLRATDFVKVSAVVEVTTDGAARFAPDVAALAKAEGLEGHAAAAEARAGYRGGGP